MPTYQLVACPTLYPGQRVECRLESETDRGKLTVRLWPVGQEQEARRVEIDLKQLVSQSYTSAIDSKGNQLLVIRSPGDKLRVTFRGSSLVFTPGETFSACASSPVPTG